MDKRHGYGYQFYGHKLGQSFKTQGIWEAIDTYNYLINKKSSYFLSVQNKQKTIYFMSNSDCMADTSSFFLTFMDP